MKVRKKILFFGGIGSNTGPDNVNKCIVKNLTPGFLFAGCENKCLRIMEAMFKLLRSDVVVVSGVSRKGCILFKAAKWMGKKTVYIMHGCAAFEIRINQTGGMQKSLEQEAYLLENGDLLLPVSRKYMNWVRREYPQYAEKTGFLFNGIEQIVISQNLDKSKRRPGSIAAAGGRSPLKNNIVVADVVSSMQGGVFLEIYGGAKAGTDPNRCNVRFMGKLPNREFLEHLTSTELFVVNSILESFSIAAVEALLCGCSVLLSEAAGVTDLLELEEHDIIHDPMDSGEIRRKIEYLMEHPNNARLIEKLDLEERSYQKMVERLEKLCQELADGGQPAGSCG